MFALRTSLRAGRLPVSTTAKCLQCAASSRSSSFLANSENPAKSKRSNGPGRGAQASLFAMSATAAFLWGSILTFTAQAEEPERPIFSKEQVEVICVIGPPLCGKATQTARIAKRFDALALGPEDDFYAEITTHQMPNRNERLRVVINAFPKTLAEAQWFEEEICPRAVAAIVFVDLTPETAIQRTQERAFSAVKSGHRLFNRETTELIKHFRAKGNFLEIDGAQSLEATWKQIEAKVDQALTLSARGQLI